LNKFWKQCQLCNNSWMICWKNCVFAW
jgi:hypothetical protein